MNVGCIPKGCIFMYNSENGGKKLIIPNGNFFKIYYAKTALKSTLNLPLMTPQTTEEHWDVFSLHEITKDYCNFIFLPSTVSCHISLSIEPFFFFSFSKRKIN